MMKQYNIRIMHHVTMTLLTKLFAERMAVLYLFFDWQYVLVLRLWGAWRFFVTCTLHFDRWF